MARKKKAKKDNDIWPDDEAEEVILVSKSEMKRDMLARQDLGKKLTELKKDQLHSFPIDDELRDALFDYQRFKHKEAKRRQLQFIGKLMRHEDMDALQEAWDLLQAGSEAQKKQLHRLEHWRDRIIEEGDKAFEELLGEFPEINRQELRQLTRQARKEAELNKPPAASRKIFQYLKAQLD